MKATIDNITYEGTVEEIAAIVERMSVKIEVKPDLTFAEEMNLNVEA